MADTKMDTSKHHDADTKHGDKDGKKPKTKDDKKKAVIAGGGIFIVLLGVGIYIYEKNKGTASTATTAAATTPNTSPWNGGGGGSGSGGGSDNDTPPPGPDAPPPKNLLKPITKPKVGVKGAGATSPKKPVAKAPVKGGKTHINAVVKKPTVHHSGGTTKVSGATSTGKTTKVPTAAVLNPNAKQGPPTKANIQKVATRNQSAGTRSVSPSAKTPSRTTTTKKK